MQSINSFLTLRFTHIFSYVKHKLGNLIYSKILINKDYIVAIKMFPKGIKIGTRDENGIYATYTYDEPVCVVQYNDGKENIQLAFKIEHVDYDSWLTQIDGAMHNMSQDVVLVADGKQVIPII